LAYGGFREPYRKTNRGVGLAAVALELLDDRFRGVIEGNPGRTGLGEGKTTGNAGG
jgi:hypothetical protein